MTSKDKRWALGMALMGFMCLSAGDAVVKSMAGMWPGTAIAALRYLAGAVGLVIAVALTHGRAGFRVPLPWVQVGRGLCVAGATVGFFMAVHVMPLADATAITFTSPMLTALLSALVLKERPPLAAVGATLLAFAGVLVILQPEVGRLGAAALWPCLSAVGMATLMILNRRSAGVAPVLVLQMLIAVAAAPMLVGVTVVGALSGIPAFDVPAPHWSVVARCILVACSATLAHTLIFLGTTRASAAVIAPMTYVQLLVATLIGTAFFGDRPGLATLLGAALIVAGGLWLWASPGKPAR